MRTGLRAITTMLAALVGLALVTGVGMVVPATAAGTSSSTGTVTGPDGSGTGAMVGAFSFDGAAWRVTGSPVSTDGSGSYEVGGLAAGTYRIGFQVGNRMSYYLNATSVDAATDVLVGEGQTVTGIDPELNWGEISVKVTASAPGMTAGVMRVKFKGKVKN